MKGFLFPGQGSQFVGMGKEIYEFSKQGRAMLGLANKILGYDIAKIMIEGTAEDLQQTSVTQPAVYLHSVIKAKLSGDFNPDAVAGHSLGEFSALVAAGAMDFHEGLNLVYKRALAMQSACDVQDSTMAAILGMENEVIEDVCKSIEETVVPANYNSPGQLVISGTRKGINEAVEKLTELGARRAIVLPVNGAFHSPLMESARKSLEEAISSATITKPICPIYQNVTGLAYTEPELIKTNLVNQLTGAVKWEQTINNMISDGIVEFVEVGGNGKTLSGMVRKIDRTVNTSAL